MKQTARVLARSNGREKSVLVSLTFYLFNPQIKTIAIMIGLNVIPAQKENTKEKKTTIIPIQTCASEK